MTISYQNQFVFPVYVLNIFIIKLNLRTNISLTYTVSIVQWNFGIFIWQNILYFSLLNFNDWCFSTILWKFSDDLNKRNLSKTCPKSTYPIDFCKICNNLISREKWKYSIYWLIVLGFNDTSTLVGHFVSSPREREKRDRRDSRGDERDD